MAGFDLGAMLASVSDSDTGREQIEYIPLVDLQSDPNNFYQLSHLDELADNIATCGLQQPLRVRPDPAGAASTSSYPATAAGRPWKFWLKRIWKNGGRCPASWSGIPFPRPCSSCA